MNNYKHKNKKYYKPNPIEQELKNIKEAINKLGYIIENKDCSCTNICECNCDGGGGDGGAPALCTAQSVCSSNERSTFVLIPANACITKIFASIQQNAAANRFASLTIRENIENGRLFFCHNFLEDSAQGAEFDATLVQPLCVGATEARAEVVAANNSAIVTLTVVYCPNCCEEPGQPGVNQPEGTFPEETLSQQSSSEETPTEQVSPETTSPEITSPETASPGTTSPETASSKTTAPEVNSQETAPDDQASPEKVINE